MWPVETLVLRVLKYDLLKTFLLCEKLSKHLQRQNVMNKTK